MASIRLALEQLDLSTSDHPYLALERLIPDCTAKEGARQQHQQKAVQRNLPGMLKEAYRRAFSRRYQALEGYAGGIEGGVTRFFSLKVSGRLAAGLGNASVLENGISLNHTYGLPYLPGTGLKGLASAAAHLGLTGATWRRGKEEQGHWTGQGEDHQVLFGTMDTSTEDAAAGIVIFHDAWWDPEPETGKPEIRLPFQLDVMTPHHQAYNLEGQDWPNDWENPIPIPFLTTGGSFRLALTGPSEWVDAAKEILLMAFRHLGFGAKTQVGYGRGEMEDYHPPVVPVETTDPGARLFRMATRAGYQPDQIGAYEVQLPGQLQRLGVSKQQVAGFLPSPTTGQKKKMDSQAGLPVVCTYMPGEHTPRKLELPST
jgi:CRISPR-associated protein Cmr6